jgi:hypothetical protein
VGVDEVIYKELMSHTFRTSFSSLNLIIIVVVIALVFCSSRIFRRKSYKLNFLHLATRMEESLGCRNVRFMLMMQWILIAGLIF